MDLRHLKSFAMVAAERNFSRAADRLGIAQPPLSRQIRELELELGVLLFDRSSRPIRLTEAGRILNEQAGQILTGIEQLTRTMRALGSSQPARVVIGVVGSIMHGALPYMVKHLRNEMQMEVDLIELTTVEQVAALKAGRIDAGLGRVRIDDPAIRREVLYLEPLVAALPAGDPLAAGGAHIAMADLMERTLIIYPSQPRPSYADQLLSLLRDHGCYPGKIIEVREVQTALGLVAAESGCAIVPQSMQDLQRRNVRYFPIAEAPTSPIVLSQRIADTGASATIIRDIGRLVFSA